YYVGTYQHFPAFRNATMCSCLGVVTFYSLSSLEVQHYARGIKLATLQLPLNNDLLNFHV
ncbi:TPA: hypothetical protein ACJPB4_001725, partial [Streptococcus pyogenes]